MKSEEWNYKVTIVLSGAYQDIRDPEFFFSNTEKEKMLAFIDILIEQGEEISIIKETPDVNTDTERSTTYTNPFRK